MNHASLEFFLNRKIEIGLALDRARGVKIGKAQEGMRTPLQLRGEKRDSGQHAGLSLFFHPTRLFTIRWLGERIETAVSMSTRAD